MDVNSFLVGLGVGYLSAMGLMWFMKFLERKPAPPQLGGDVDINRREMEERLREGMPKKRQTMWD